MRIAIIGAGLIGVSTAYFLGRAGHSVVVLERREGPGLETSFANGGMITPSQADPWNAPGIAGKLLRWIGREDAPVLVRARSVPPLLGWGLAFLRNSSHERFKINFANNARLARYSLEVLRQLRRDTDLRYDSAAVGTMKFYRDPRSLRESAWLTRELEGAGIRFESLDATGVIAREPALEPIAGDIAGGMYFPDDESGDAHKYCAGLAQLAANGEVEFRYGTPVQSIDCVSGRVAALTTPAGAVRADRFVLAAGSYSTALARTAGFSIPVQPVKGYSLTLDIGGWDPVPRTPLVDDDLHVAATPLAGRLRVAGTAEFAGFDLELRKERLRPMLGFVSRLFPRQAARINESRVQAWAGLRPYACDGVPVLGPSPLANLFLNTGHGHLGWSMAAGSGKLVADLICDRRPDLDAAPYRLDRFGRG